MPFSLSRTMKYARVSNCHSANLHHSWSSHRPGGSLSRTVLDDANSAGSHLPNRGRHTYRWRKGHQLRSQQQGRWCRQQDRRHGQGQRGALRSELQATVYSIQHTQSACGPPAPQPGGLLSQQDPECHRQKEPRVSQRTCVSCQLRRH